MRNSLSSNLPAAQSELSVLGATVRAELTAVGRAASEMLIHAFAVGEALNKAKKLVGHGNWQAWVDAECGLSSRSTRAYMRLANHRALLEGNWQRAADLSIRAALRLIGTGMTMRKRVPASALKVASWKAAALGNGRRSLAASRSPNGSRRCQPPGGATSSIASTACAPLWRNRSSSPPSRL